MKNILILGASSAIASSTARLWAKEGASFYLVGRNESKLKDLANDLVARGAHSAKYSTLDLNHISEHGQMLQKSYDSLGKIDIALIAHGSLPNQKECEKDVDLALKEFSNNGISVIALLTQLANHFEDQKSGTIAVISSVAGDRGRPTNYVYGTAKAAVSTFCEGMRARLYKSNVHLITIKPGFVDTPMTKGLSLPPLLMAKPEKVAEDIFKGVNKRNDVLYTPWFWKTIMNFICSIPTSIFKKLKL